MARTAAERTMDAEVRFVEEGHRVRLGTDTRALVKSDTRPGVTYRVGANATPGLVTWTCDHSQYDNDGSHYPARPAYRAEVPCKHAAGLARRLEREGLLEWVEGRWIPTPAAIPTVVPDGTDPFDGLPGC